MDPLKRDFQPWSPAGHLKGSYDVNKISWGPDGLTFTLVPDGIGDSRIKAQTLELIWDAGHIVSYHVTDETYRADCWTLDFEANGRIYTCPNSPYIASLRQKSPLFPDDVTHFLLVGTNMIVDILAKDAPTVRVRE